ncbi:hypothetical protein ONS95_003365 [Cadophora gregata]|uniref:uncharacterized protein n=1 Tax=Cadophora gregata TaxID=51156 RepID=UPI0026DB42E9|nr:uncharacterized protein ONS95_003365 [Cadophora gregata]KAK0108567.1 hypothetical protein ONS95_003365 [Cadophora gregata]KAK0108839.1 hypothetical protein ONS96_002680 [Cadophora gregata f. sp. sojae]
MRWSPGSRRAQLTYVLLAVVGALYYLTLTILASGPVKFDPSYGRLRQTTSSSKVAIATFLCENYVGDENAVDNYFIGARTLHYQLKIATQTKMLRKDIPFLVVVTRAVTQEKRDRLERDGATVVVVDDVKLPWWVETGVKKWKDQFTKLRIFEMVEYERILFIDSDTLITRSIDRIFSSPLVQDPSPTLSNLTHQIKNDEALLPAHYLFAALPDNAFAGERDHTYPPNSTSTDLSAGFWLAAPSNEMFTYLMSVMQHWKRFDPFTMEQSLLNYAFRREGPMPWGELDPSWIRFGVRRGRIRRIGRRQW